MHTHLHSTEPYGAAWNRTGLYFAGSATTASCVMLWCMRALLLVTVMGGLRWVAPLIVSRVVPLILSQRHALQLMRAGASPDQAARIIVAQTVGTAGYVPGHDIQAVTVAPGPAPLDQVVG